MMIRYEISDTGSCAPLCWMTEGCMVGSIACQKCAYYISRDREKGFVKCSHPKLQKMNRNGANT